MSVSDVVELNGVYYYCDHIGFKKITEFCSWYIFSLIEGVDLKRSISFIFRQYKVYFYIKICYNIITECMEDTYYEKSKISLSRCCWLWP
jgi:hypothetical protein